MKINENYLRFNENYLYATTEDKLITFRALYPERNIINLGMIDVPLPLIPAVQKRMQKSLTEMGRVETYMGYGPEQGYPFLLDAISDEYGSQGLDIPAQDIFINSGAKNDLSNILDIFDTENVSLIPNPYSPVYLDNSIMTGRKVVFMECNEENGFLPLPDASVQADIIYLSSPNNPTGAVYTREQLKKWVDYALEMDAVILFDAAYNYFIQDKELPRSIFEIEGAKKCAIEFCSFSKIASLTCASTGYTIIPHELSRGGVQLGKLWARRQSTKIDNHSYILQRGASALFSKEGRAQIGKNLQFYMENAKVLSDALRRRHIWFTGGANSPYIWFKCPGQISSWEFFDYLLENANIVGTPGAGFGTNGEGYFRISALADRVSIMTAAQRLANLYY